MNENQLPWWHQARSDLATLDLLRGNGAAPCQQLHYLQMSTENIAKAYFWRSGMPPPKSHAAFVQFMRSVASASKSERQRVAEAFEFKRFDDFQGAVLGVLPIGYALQRLAPALAHDGPNPEDPWPEREPRFVPATFAFDVWTELAGKGRGRQLMRMIRFAIENFPKYC